jgi:hypothetical protein
MLNDAFAERDLAVSGHDNGAIPADTKNCGGANQAILGHESRLDYISRIDLQLPFACAEARRPGL